MPRARAAVKAQPAKKPAPKPNGKHLKAVEPQRRVAPASIRKEVDATAPAESTGVAEFKQTSGPAEPVLELKVQEVEPVGTVSKEKLANLAFMREKCKIIIHDSSDQQADPRFYVSVNGRRQLFERGREYVVPRFIVEGLARAKPIGYQNEEFFKPDGERSVRWPAKRGLRYPFAVLEDPSGDRGKQWLHTVLRQP